ncbi:MAG: hypothetical protein KAT31_16005, partial [Bacteroidales bacterium]|nr:hypothetical protein [Bacteroidales bacterium]
MICFISACNNDSVSDKQAESFLKYYTVGIVNTGTVVIQTSDGYAIMGNFENGSGQEDIFVIFTDEFGREKTGGPIDNGTDLNYNGYSMIRLRDGGYIISGSSFNDTQTQKSGYLVNISSDGRILWEQNYSGYQELEFRDVFEALDDNLIMTGYVKDNQEDEDVIIFKTTAQGEFMWIKQLPLQNRNDVGEAIIEYDKLY